LAIKNGSLSPLEALRRVYLAFPVPSVGSELAVQYLSTGRLPQARAILKEVALQRLDAWSLDDETRKVQETAKEQAACALDRLWPDTDSPSVGMTADRVAKCLRDCLGAPPVSALPPKDAQYPLLVIEVKGAESNLEVWLDNRDDQHSCSGSLAVSSPIDVSPGKHRIIWQDQMLGESDRAGSCERPVVSPRQPIEISVVSCVEPVARPGSPRLLGQPPADSSVVTDRAREDPPRGRDWIGWGSLIGGIVLGVAGGVAADIWASQEAEHRKKAAPYCADKGCLPQGADEMETALNRRDWKWAGYAAGAVGVALTAVGAYKLIGSSPAKPTDARRPSDLSWLVTPTITPNAAGLLVERAF
jgi:hypothetical protein